MNAVKLCFNYLHIIIDKYVLHFLRIKKHVTNEIVKQILKNESIPPHLDKFLEFPLIVAQTVIHK